MCDPCKKTRRGRESVPVCWLVFKTSEGRKTVLVGSTPTLFRQHLRNILFLKFLIAHRLQDYLMSEKLVSRTENGIGWIIFNNAEKRNAVSLQMAKRAAECIKEHEENDEVRVLII